MARVLVVGFSVVPGPDRHGVQLLHVVRALASRFTVDVLTLRVGELAYVERFHKTRMLRVPVSEGSLSARIEAFRRAVRRQLEGAEYDVVHFRDAWAGLPVIEKRNALGYRTVFDVARSVHGDALPGEGRDDLADAEALCCEQADLVLTGTEMGRRFLLQRLPSARAERVVVASPGVDVDRFDSEPGGPRRADDAPVVLYTGSIARGHGVRVLLHAFRDVVERLPARLVLAGPLAREFMDPLGTALDQLGLAPHVELLGAIDNEDMARVISRATVCVAPAAADLVERPLASFPTRLLEYLACHRAVIAPRRSSVRELIQDGVEGLLFDPLSPRDLADKIVRVLSDEPLRTRLAEAGQKRVRARYPASALRRRILEAYATILPPEAWNTVGAAPTRLAFSPPGLVARSADGDDALLDHEGDDGGVLPDTSPALQGYTDDDLEVGSATLITRMTIEETTPGAAPAAARAALPDAEPWLVIAGDGSITRAALFGVAEVGESDGTPSDGVVAPPSPVGATFVAGELEARVPPPSLVPATAPTIVREASYPFVAAGELLGPGLVADPPGAVARAEPES